MDIEISVYEHITNYMHGFSTSMGFMCAGSINYKIKNALIVPVLSMMFFSLSSEQYHIIIIYIIFALY